jgi:hypothetical protein
MARATTPAADAVDQAASAAPPVEASPAEPVATQPPDTLIQPDPEPAAPAAETPAWGPRLGHPHTGDDWGTWVYTGPPGRTYAYIPVTVDPGDVIRHCGIPADDGCWQPTDAESTRWPDNHRPEPVADTVKEG